MPVTQNHTQIVLDAAKIEGHPILHVAPTQVNVPGIPPEWAKVLSSHNARADVIKVLWDSMARRVPKILRELKRSLQGVGLLITDSRPLSMIYFLTLEDGEPHYYRGYLPSANMPPVAKKLPDEFLQFYQIHDGWVDQFEFMGPMRASDWHPLGSDPKKPSNKFLVVLFSSGGALLGFDLMESPALCYLLPAGDDPPEVIPKVWARLDRWISGRMEELLPFASK